MTDIEQDDENQTWSVDCELENGDTIAVGNSHIGRLIGDIERIERGR